MGRCYRIFKIGVILLTLVQFGLGYTKVYQLFTDIRSSSGGGSGSDLAWLPYLFIQIFTTVFIILQVYFLSRELCRDNFMYDCCFRCCFVLTTLNFLLVIFPKTIINLVYHTSDVALEEWWTQIVDSLDSIFANLANLGFQIILYMKLFKKLCACLKCCRQKITPIMVNAVNKAKNINKKSKREDDKDATVENGEELNDTNETVGCCLFIPMSKKDDLKDDSCENKNEENGEDKPKPVTNHVTNIKSKTLARKGEIEGKIDAAVNEKLDKVSNKVNKYKGKLQTSVGNRTKALKQGVTSKINRNKQNDDVCACDNPVVSNNNVITITEDPEETSVESNKETAIETNNETSNVTNKVKCDTCGKVIDTSKPEPNRLRKCYDSRTMMKCRTLCGLLENRPLCMKITLTMSCVHFLVYIVELIFVLI